MTIRWTLGVAALCCALPACNATPAMTSPDAAIPDAALSDAAVEPDAAFELCGSVPGGRISPLPASCLPRCTAATFAVYRECTDVDCIISALSADETPNVHFGAGPGTFSLGCGSANGADWTCVQWQTFAVMAQLCPDAYDVWSDCRLLGGECNAEADQLSACGQADPAFSTMFRNLVTMCFAS